MAASVPVGEYVDIAAALSGVTLLRGTGVEYPEIPSGASGRIPPVRHRFSEGQRASWEFFKDQGPEARAKDRCNSLVLEETMQAHPRLSRQLQFAQAALCSGSRRPRLYTAEFHNKSPEYGRAPGDARHHRDDLLPGKPISGFVLLAVWQRTPQWFQCRPTLRSDDLVSVGTPQLFRGTERVHVNFRPGTDANMRPDRPI